MGLISNGTTIFDAGSMAAGLGASMTFIKKLTASSSATLSFVDRASSVVLDNTYKEYLFTFNNIHPATDNQQFAFQVDTGTNTSYNIACTSSTFRAYHNEAGNDQGLIYSNSNDLHQQTDNQILQTDIGNGNDESLCGTLTLYDPSSTTFVKHFIGVTNYYQAFGQTGSFGVHYAGYCNVTAAIDGVRFKMSSGNIDAGTIKMYGIK